ncbi:MAG: hypothetical protein H5T41_10090 [Methanomassiliicoccales archaeon]|nr:hypothetical protein [Methanomassiliicoccales archaeon]
MKVVDLRAYPICIPLKETLVTSYGERGFAEFVLVEIETDEGIIGVGESASIPIYDEGNPAGDMYILKHYLKPLLLGQDPTNIGNVHFLMNKLVRGHRFVKAAIDIALYDIMGKYTGLPVCRLLGSAVKNIPVIWLTNPAQGSKAIEEASRRINEGFRTIKVKVGKNWCEEIAFLRELRKEIGENFDLRLDANGAWHWRQALVYIRQMENLNISLLEQPVPAWDIVGLKRLTSRSPIPIVADECILTIYDVHEIARQKVVDYVNIKVCRSGGLYPALKMAAVAEAAGIVPLVGSMLETGVGTMAGAHFAALLNCNTLPAEVIGPLIAQDDVVVPPIQYEGGKLILKQAPGLGIELDKQKIQQYLKKEV